MKVFFEFAILGLGLAGGYALATLGIVLIYRGSGVVNFAQGGFALVGAYVYYETSSSIPKWASCLCGVAAAALIGLLVEQLVMWPMRRSSFLIRVVATLGVLEIIEQAAFLKYGSTPIFVEGVVPTGAIRLFGIFTISQQELWLFGIAAVVTGVLWFGYRHTRMGLATSAVAENELLAASLGWSPRSVASFNWALGAGLAGFAGILMVPITTLGPNVFDGVLVITLSAAVFAAFRSFPLALCGALIIGILQSELTQYVSTPGWTEAAPVLVIIVVLVFRGRSLPVRSFIAQRLPTVGSGRVRPFPAIVSLALAVGSLWVFGTTWTVAVMASATFAVIALSLVVVTGYAGQVSLAQYAFAGMGALIAGRMAAVWHLPFLLVLILGVVLVVPIGVLFALPAIRTRGVNLAVITLGLALVFETMILDNPSYVGGVVTGTIVRPPEIFGFQINAVDYPQRYAAFCLIVLAAVCVLVATIRRRGAGRRMLAVRDNERAAASVGINVSGAKIYAFAVAAAIASLGGILIAFETTQINFTTFGAVQSIYALLPSMIGGIGYVVGAIVGGVVVSGGITQQILSNFFSLSNWWLFILGIILVVQLILVPDGVAALMVHQVRAIMKLVWRKVIRHDDSSRILSDDQEEDVVPRVLDLKDVTVRYGATNVLEGINLQIRPGEVVGLIGPNGAGKTTLIDVATGFAKLASGQVQLDGLNVGSYSPQRRARMGLTRSWQSDELFEVMSIEDNLRTAGDPGGFATYVRGVLFGEPKKLNPVISSSVRQFGIEKYLRSLPSELPYADRRLVGIARAVATGPSVLLLDEPAAGLDATSTEELITHIRTLAKERGVGILLIEHDVEMVMKTCDRVLAINFGKEIASGTPEEVRANPNVIAAYLGRAATGDSARKPEIEESAPSL